MRFVLWVLCGLATWLWVHDVPIFVPGPFWFPPMGVVVMGVLTGILGAVWERTYEAQIRPFGLGRFLAMPLCLVAWVGGGLFGAGGTLGNTSAGYKALNALLDGTIGAITTWLMVYIMLKWRARPTALFGVTMVIGVAAILAPILVMVIIEGVK